MKTIGDIQQKFTGGVILDHAGGKADRVLDFDAQRERDLSPNGGVVDVFKSDVHLLPFFAFLCLSNSSFVLQKLQLRCTLR